MGKFRRKKVNCTIHGVDIYNPSPEQRKEMKEYLSKLNSVLIESIGLRASQAIEKGVELTDDELTQAKIEALKVQQKDMDRKTRYWLTEFTSLENDDFDNGDLKDQSPEFRVIILKVNEVCIRPIVLEVQESFEMIYSQAIKQFYTKYKVGE